MKEKEYEVKNKSGLHARPAALFVSEIKQFNSKIMLTYDDCSVDAKSIMLVLGLAIPLGSKIRIQVEGEDEDRAIEVINALFAANFGEE